MILKTAKAMKIDPSQAGRNGRIFSKSSRNRFDKGFGLLNLQACVMVSDDFQF